MDDVRDDLLAAMGDDDDSGESEVLDTPDSGSAPPPEPTGQADSPESGDDAPVRDALGRFVPKSTQGAQPSGTIQPAPLPAEQPAPVQAAPQALQPPPGWSNGAREHWAATPAAVQQEVMRREQEMARFVNETANVRGIGERFFSAVQPFMTVIQAEGTDPITATQNLMQFATRMRLGTPAEKAATLAELVQIYGVDVGSLDTALDARLRGVALPPDHSVDQNYVQNAVQQALSPLYQMAQQRQYQVQQELEGKELGKVQAFAADPKNKFFQDLRATMADMIEVANRQGVDMSLEDAYQRAGMLHPEIGRAMIAQRQAASTQAMTRAAQQAKASAVSVRGSAPVGNPDATEPSSIRESIEAAIEAHSRY